MVERQYVRTKLSGMNVYLVDGAGLCTGTLENMSCFGMCISDIPRCLQSCGSRLDAVVFGRGYNFKLQLEQKWHAEVGQTTTIGVAIIDVPWVWADLSMRQEIMAKEPYASVSTPALIAARKGPGRNGMKSGSDPAPRK